MSQTESTIKRLAQIEGLKRRDRAIERLASLQSFRAETRKVTEAIIRCLEPSTGYRAAWPLQSMLADATGLSKSSVGRAISEARERRLFDVIRLSSVGAVEDYLRRLGAVTEFGAAQYKAPNVYEVNYHPIWDSTSRDFR